MSKLPLVRSQLISKTSLELVVSERTINAVINHQFESVRNALALNNSVEISGFGKFVFSQRRGANKLASYLKIKENYEKRMLEELSSTKQRNLLTRLKNIEQDINSLKVKIKDEL